MALLKCENCGLPTLAAWEVKSCGPNKWEVESLPLCNECWSVAVRGDGHSYSGSFSSRVAAEDHCAFMNGED